MKSLLSIMLLIAALTACNQRRMTSWISVDLPADTDNNNAKERAQPALDSSASKLCGKPVKVALHHFEVSNKMPPAAGKYKAFAEVDCD